MGFFDKVKEQAEKAKAQAQDLKVKVGDKVDEVQAKRKVDELLDDLGRFLYAEQTGRPMPGADAEIQRLVGELKALEAEGVVILTTEAPATTAEPEAPAAEEPPAAVAEPSAVAEPAAPPPLPGAVQ